MKNKMTADVDQTSPIELQKVKMSRKNASSDSSTTGPKMSIFAAKSGFIIPKNKLLGSLVPVFKGGKKPGGNDAASEESTNQVLRKTKWGPDPTQDAAVKKGRALAYQTRVDQITQQLKSGILESGGAEDSEVADQHADPNLSSPKIDSKDLELLKLEWREVIGEILKLNPSYKAPPDYDPLLKEATFPIPVKDHPRCNFVGLIFGPGGETQKRLEKETGARIHVLGTKANTGEKVEISPSGGNDTQDAYEELNVHVSADTFEKVDGAIALIELLVTSVSGNLMDGNNMNFLNQSQGQSTPFLLPTSDQGVGQSVVGSAQTPQQTQFQYHGLQFPGVLAQAPGHPRSFIPSHNSSAPIHNNTLPVHSLPLNPTAMASMLGPQPLPASGLNLILQNTPLVPSRSQLPMQVPSHPYPPRNFSMPTSQPSSAQTNILASFQFSGNQPPPAMLSPVSGSLASSLLRPVSTVPPGPQSDRPLNPLGSSSGWSAAPTGVSASLGDTGQMVPPMISFQDPWPLAPQPGFLSSALPSNMPAANIVSSVSFPSGPSTINIPINHPSGASSFASVPPPQMGSSSMAMLIQSSSVGMAAAPLTHASVGPVPGRMPVALPMASTSQPTPQSGIIGSFPGHAVSSTPTRPPARGPNPLHSGPSDFTFQLHHSMNPAAQLFPGPNNQSGAQDTRFPRPPIQPSSSQVSSFRMAVPNSISSPGMHSFSSPRIGNQMGQTQAHMPPIPFAGSSTGTLMAPRVPAFSNASPIILQTRNFSPIPQLPNLAGPFPPRPPNPLQVQPTYPAPITPRGNFIPPNQQSSRNLSFASGPGGQQIYDPFSPTSVSNMPQHQGDNLVKGRKPEADPEYEDLMTSVGVK
ncbi:splicing factor 1 [Ricinus communis]|uniref:splicing factor 1 n=1 Tax=Ricinus communis TaxID=3988 RepID=UPI00201A7F08|nr:splicing factor 1 [Ricinus communis]